MKRPETYPENAIGDITNESKQILEKQSEGLTSLCICGTIGGFSQR